MSFLSVPSGPRPPHRLSPPPTGLWNLRTSLVLTGELTYVETVRLLASLPEEQIVCLCFDRGWGDMGQPLEWFLCPVIDSTLDFRVKLARVSLRAKHLLIMSGIADDLDTYGGFKARCILDMRRPTAAEVNAAEAVEAGFVAGVRWCAQAGAHDEQEERLARNRKERARRAARHLDGIRGARSEERRPRGVRDLVAREARA
jgi:hypothetical protein